MNIPHARPYQEVDWRSRRCEHLIEQGKRPSRCRDDRRTRDAWSFFIALARASDQHQRARVRQHHPDLAAAVDLRKSDDAFRRWELEARLLAREPINSVAGRFALTAGAVESYAALYFDVLGALDARYYIVLRAIGFTPGRAYGEKDVETWLKLFAYFGGGHALDAVVNYFRDVKAIPQDLARVDPSRLARLRSHLAVRAAILARCVPDDDVRLFALQRLAGRLEAERLSGDPGESLPPVRPGQSMLEGLLKPGKFPKAVAERAVA